MMLPLFENVPTRRLAVVTSPGSGGGVAFAAHVGGFLFGVSTVRLLQVRPPLQPRR